jgi:iron complex outermembrane recepter protein
MARSTARKSFVTTTLLCGAALGPLFGAFGAPAQAQTAQPATAQPSSTQPSSTQASKNGQATTVQEVVVTGSILRRKLSATDNPVTTLTSQDLDIRGVTTMADAVQSLAANGAATLTNSFTANGAFAAGASAVSLRGLTTNSTLTLIDGMRMAYYPMADDGVRNFVDMNTIPDVIVDRIDTLKDGASSTYGADAIAGVVNVITKKTYEGLTVKAEDGMTQEGGASSMNFQALAGHGDLAKDGYNFYIGAEYEHDDDLWNRQRGYPYDTANLSSSCGASLLGGQTCRYNNVVNGVQANGSFLGVGATTVPTVLPVDANGNALGNYQLLNQAAGCGALQPVTVTQAMATGSKGPNPGIQGSPVNLCQQDIVHDYRQILPDDKRVSLSFRATKELGGDAEAFVSGTFYQNQVTSSSYIGPSNIQNITTPGADLTPYSTAGITLPIYVCSTGINCSLANGTYNPNNPFANPNNPYTHASNLAEIFYLFPSIPPVSTQLSDTYRLATGVKGSFDWMGQWHYDVEATASETDLTNTQQGNVFIPNLLQAIATGSYNFVNPKANSAAENYFVEPTNIQTSNSRLAMVQGTLSRDLYDLPGGPLQLGLVGAVRYESVRNPSANPDANGPEDRWFGINAFGAIGSRTSEAVSFELDAPFVKQFDVDVSGRFDNYSTGQNAFSPKIEGRFKPFDWITFRATASKGFRIPSFGEGNAVEPTIGYITGSAPASFQAAHGNDGYGLNYGIGLAAEANPNLKPETSENFTGGVVLEPNRHFDLSVDYYFIRKKDVITSFPDPGAYSAAVNAYYNGGKVPAGYQVIAGGIDPQYPNAQPELGFVVYPFENENQEFTGGYDIGAATHWDLPYGIKYTSMVDADYVLYLDMVTPSGKQDYAGTISPYNDVSASGTPKFRGNWENSFAWGAATFALTTYYTDGYTLQAVDLGDTPGLCVSNGASASPYNPTYADGVTPVRCKTKAFIDVDSHVTYQVTPHIQLYLNVINLFNAAPPLDPMTYGSWQYNPAWANAGIMGRTFKLGVKATF